MPVQAQLFNLGVEAVSSIPCMEGLSQCVCAEAPVSNPALPYDSIIGSGRRQGNEAGMPCWWRDGISTVGVLLMTLRGILWLNAVPFPILNLVFLFVWWLWLQWWQWAGNLYLCVLVKAGGRICLCGQVTSQCLLEGSVLWPLIFHIMEGKYVWWAWPYSLLAPASPQAVTLLPGNLPIQYSLPLKWWTVICFPADIPQEAQPQ